MLNEKIHSLSRMNVETLLLNYADTVENKERTRSSFNLQLYRNDLTNMSEVVMDELRERKKLFPEIKRSNVLAFSIYGGEDYLHYQIDYLFDTRSFVIQIESKSKKYKVTNMYHYKNTKIVKIALFAREFFSFLLSETTNMLDCSIECIQLRHPRILDYVEEDYEELEIDIPKNNLDNLTHIKIYDSLLNIASDIRERLYLSSGYSEETDENGTYISQFTHSNKAHPEDQLDASFKQDENEHFVQMVARKKNSIETSCIEVINLPEYERVQLVNHLYGMHLLRIYNRLHLEHLYFPEPIGV